MTGQDTNDSVEFRSPSYSRYAKNGFLQSQRVASFSPWSPDHFESTSVHSIVFDTRRIGRKSWADTIVVDMGAEIRSFRYQCRVNPCYRQVDGASSRSHQAVSRARRCVTVAPPVDTIPIFNSCMSGKTTGVRKHMFCEFGTCRQRWYACHGFHCNSAEGCQVPWRRSTVSTARPASGIRFACGVV